MGTIFILSCLCFLTLIGQHGVSSSACTDPADRDECYSLIAQRLGDRDLFWFGSSLKTNCPVYPTFDLDCIGLREPTVEGYSLADLLFEGGSFNASTINNYLDVSYTSLPGSYEGCLHTYMITDTITFELDALSTQSLEPWYARDMPEITWNAKANTWYSLFMLDPGWNQTHAAWMNINGNDMSTAEVVKAYAGPGNFRSMENIYVFVLYEQNQGKMAIQMEWSQVAAVQSIPLGVYATPEVMDLHGPVAVNWMPISFDPYTAVRLSQLGVFNCIPFVQDALDTHNRPFLPDDLDLTVWVNLTMESPEQEYTFCCESHEFPAETVAFDPIGNGTLAPITVKTGTPMTIKLRPHEVVYPGTPIGTSFIGKHYAVVMVDPDIPGQNIGSEALPFLHWLHINLEVDITTGSLDLTDGTELVGYMGPLPANEEPHTYYFMVMEQTSGSLDLQDTSDYTGNCSLRNVMERCFFNVGDFMADNSLDLVGATWFNAGMDDWVRKQYDQKQSSVCAGRQGYSRPCPTEDDTDATDGATHSNGGLLVMVLSLLAFYGAW